MKMGKQKITFGEMRKMGVRGLLVYCSDYHCSHWVAVSGDLAGDVRLSDIEPRFTCQACGGSRDHVGSSRHTVRAPGTVPLLMPRRGRSLFARNLPHSSRLYSRVTTESVCSRLTPHGSACVLTPRRDRALLPKGRLAMNTPDHDTLVRAIEDVLTKPVFFKDVLARFSAREYRSILRAWSDIRARVSLSRDESGRYWISPS